MDKPIMYYWAPCTTCAIATRYADEHGIELDLRDVEYEGPYNELLGLGGDANKIPYLYSSSKASMMSWNISKLSGKLLRRFRDSSRKCIIA